MLDLIRELPQAFPKSKNGSGATNQNNGVIEISLDKTWLLSKLAVTVYVTQAFTGAPTSSDVRRFFQNMQIEVDKGKGQKVNFHGAYDIFRILNPQAPAPVVVLGTASTAYFTFEVNFAQLMMIGGMSTSLLSGAKSTLNLKFNVAPDANNGFISGTSPGVATYAVTVMPWELRAQTPADRKSTATGYGLAQRELRQMGNIGVTQAGFSEDVNIKGGGKLRTILLHCFDASTYGNLTDTIIQNGAAVSMEVNGFNYFDNTPLQTIQQVNAQKLNMPGTGVVALYFGSDPLAWPDLRDVKEPQFTLDIPASANLPASARIELLQDMTYGLEKLSGPLRA